MHRVVVVGCSGSGKTTVAREVARKLDFPLLELDSLFHQPNWVELPDREFRAKIAEFALQPSWVIDGNYTSHGVRELIWPAADTVVWLDLSRPVVMRQVLGRTLRRVWTRQELWNGNKEPWTNLYRWDPDKNIIRWAWTRHGPTRQEYEEALAEPDTVHLRVHRLRTRGEVEVFLGVVSGP